jgi:hypothetical protein
MKEVLKDYLPVLNKNSILYEFIEQNPKIEVLKIYPTIPYIESGIYCIFTLHNSKVYIGSSKNIQYRFRKHREGLKWNKHFGIYLQRVYNKYSIDNLRMFVVEKTSCLEQEELKWIKYFDCVKNGYNSTEDTQRNFYNSELILNNIMRRSKPVISLDLKGNFIERFNSVSEAARFLNDQSTNISYCCINKKGSVKGRIFLYETDYNSNLKYNYINNSGCHLAELNKREEYREKNRNKIITESQRISSSEKQGIKIKCITDNLEFRSFKHAGKHYNLAPSSIVRSIKADRYCKKLKFVLL